MSMWDKALRGVLCCLVGCFLLSVCFSLPVWAAEFSNSKQAKIYIEKKFPGMEGMILWKKAMAEDRRFKRYVASLKKNNPDAFYRFMNQIWQTHDYFPGDQYTKRVPKSASQEYYCHDFAWRVGKRRKTKVNTAKDKVPVTAGNHVDVDAIVANPRQYGFQYVGNSYRKLRSADVVVYVDDTGKAMHSALVIRRNPKGVRSGNDIYMMSKDGPNSIFRHRLGKDGEPNFFRDNFAAGGFKFFRRK